MADGILKEVLGSFNPFCDGDKDPMAEKSDQCANYTTPPCQNPDDEGCPGLSQPKLLGKSTAEKRDGVPLYLLYFMFFVALNLCLI